MRRVMAAVAMAAMLGVSACGADSASSPIASAPMAATGELTLVGGGTFDAARLDAGPLALWFWAPG